MVRVNCAAIPATLIESELFGREKRRIHRRHRAADRPLRAGGPLDHLPRRDRRPAVGGAGQAAAGARGAPDRAPGQPASDPGRTSGSSPRRIATSRSGSASRLLPRGSVLPAQRVPDPRAAAARARRGHPAARLAVRRGVLRTFGKRIDSIAPATHGRSCTQYPWPGNIRELRNVVERAMIVGERAPADDSAFRARSRRGAAERETRGRPEGAHPSSARERGLAHSRKQRRRRSPRACGRRRWKPGWRSWDCSGRGARRP